MRTEGALPRTVRGLVRSVGGLVDEAVRTKDERTLARIFGHLAEIDLPISAPLARTLRLVDRVGGSPRARGVKASATPGLVVPEWRAIYPPSGDVPREVLARHALILGETGAGKTASAILPVVAAMARAPRERLGAALVIDPKRELRPALERLAPGRLRHVTAKTAVLNLMRGPRWRLDDDLAAGRWLSAATRILFRITSFSPTNPARVLVSSDHAHGGSNSEFFDREGTNLAASVLSLVLMVTSPKAPSPREWAGDDPQVRRWLEDLVARAVASGPNVVALTAWALESPVLNFPEPTGEIDGISPAEKWPFARVARATRSVWGEASGEGRDVLERLVGYWAPMAAIDRQFAGVRATARVVCSEFSSPAVSHTLRFGCEPGSRAGLDFTRAVGRDSPGEIVLFQPARDHLDDLVAVALKALFFEAVLDDEDRAKGGSDLPLVGYVADEFHRFITSDVVHGEQSFLDTCRSFGAFCVLASQSVASLEHALAHGGGSVRKDETAISMLWNNTGSKLVFRTTDSKTSERLQELCPHRPGLAGVARVRPVSTLAPANATRCSRTVVSSAGSSKRSREDLPRGPSRGSRVHEGSGHDRSQAHRPVHMRRCRACGWISRPRLVSRVLPLWSLSALPGSNFPPHWRLRRLDRRSASPGRGRGR